MEIITKSDLQDQRIEAEEFLRACMTDKEIFNSAYFQMNRTKFCLSIERVKEMENFSDEIYFLQITQKEIIAHLKTLRTFCLNREYKKTIRKNAINNIAIVKKRKNISQSHFTLN